MKKIILLFAFLPLFITSCGSNGEGDESEDLDTLDMSNFEGMDDYSLAEDGLDLKLMLPVVSSSIGDAISPSVEHEEGDYLWYLSIGPRFELIIEDYGKEKDKTIGEKQRLLELNKIFDYEFLVDEPKLIMYKRTLHEGQGGEKLYFCYGEVTIDGLTYVLRSGDEGALKPIIEDMVKTIRSARPIKNA